MRLQLARKCLFAPTCFRQAILAHKVGQTDLAFGMRLGFIMVCACKITSVCEQRLRFVPPYINTQTHTERRLFASLYTQPAKLQTDNRSRQPRTFLRVYDLHYFTCLRIKLTHGLFLRRRRQLHD